MADDELISFILRSREKKRSDDQISRALLSVGWKKERIAAAFQKIDSEPERGPEGKEREEPEQERREKQAKAQESAAVPKQAPSPRTAMAVKAGREPPKTNPERGLQPAAHAAAPQAAGTMPVHPPQVRHKALVSAANPPETPHDDSGELETAQGASETSNPAFSNLEKAKIAPKPGWAGKLLVLVMLLAFFAGAYYLLFVSQSGSAAFAQIGESFPFLKPQHAAEARYLPEAQAGNQNSTKRVPYEIGSGSLETSEEGALSAPEPVAPVQSV